MPYNYYGMPNYNYQQQPVTQDDRIWVASEQAADAYLVAPGSFVRLWDSQKPVFYEKRTDQTGRPMPLEKYEYKRYQDPAPVQNDFTDRFSAIEARLKALEERGANNE